MVQMSWRCFRKTTAQWPILFPRFPFSWKRANFTRVECFIQFINHHFYISTHVLFSISLINGGVAREMENILWCTNMEHRTVPFSVDNSCLKVTNSLLNNFANGSFKKKTLISYHTLNRCKIMTKIQFEQVRWINMHIMQDLPIYTVVRFHCQYCCYHKQIKLQ